MLDIGCGRGDSSIFLAKHFRVIVVCFDLWISSKFLSRKVASDGYRNAVFPLDLDGGQDLPFADDYFDAMFCMQALHSFGGDANVLRRLLRHLKPGGRFVVGGTCFNEEPHGGQLPDIFSETGSWNADGTELSMKSDLGGDGKVSGALTQTFKDKDTVQWRAVASDKTGKVYHHIEGTSTRVK